MRIKDVDGEGTTLDVVAVPEGFSFQIGPIPDDNTNSHVSVIVSRRDAVDLVDYIMHGGKNGTQRG